ncbi:MAG: hypothetical protein M3N21_05520 [Actinomycetota bacterium]|nr:hypothetical protein [Actinomycetota bacterium]
MSTVRIDNRFAGPPGTANGGVTAGLLSAATGVAEAEVTLRRPPPLDVDLHVTGQCLATDSGDVVAELTPAQVKVEPIPAPPVELARTASAAYAGLTLHPFPGCFVCGVDRPAPDGLGVRPGPIAPDVVAGTWTPREPGRFLVWAALDCPGGWSADQPGRPMVLGRIAARINREPELGEECVVAGWLLGQAGRKTEAGSAVYSLDGSVLAVARATWISVEVSQVGRQG